MIKIDDDDENENDDNNKIMRSCMDKCNEIKSVNKELVCKMKHAFRQMQFILVMNDID